MQAQGNLRSAEQNAARSQALLDKHEIRAPFAGVVTTKDAQPGEIVSPAAAGGGFTRTGVCTIVDMKSLEVEVEVNEALHQPRKAWAECERHARRLSRLGNSGEGRGDYSDRQSR